jgi:hypothetical protein
MPGIAARYAHATPAMSAQLLTALFKAGGS